MKEKHRSSIRNSPEKAVKTAKPAPEQIPRKRAAKLSAVKKAAAAKPERAPLERNANQSVSRALAILDLLAAAQADLGVRDIARRLGLAASIAQRLIRTLAEAGYVEQSPETQRYRIGFMAYRIGQVYVAANDLINLALSEMRQLSDRHGLNAFLGVLREDRVVYLAATQSNGPITIRNLPGSTTHVHTTALGKALLFDLADADVLQRLGPAPYARLTRRSITDAAEFLANLAEARRQGHALCDEENLDNVYAFGAPIRDHSGQCVAALSAALPRNLVDPARLAEQVTLLREATRRISQKLGAPAWALR